MKRALAIFAALSVSLAVAGCSKNKSQPAAHAPVDLHPVAQGPAWSVSYQSNCDGVGGSEACAGTSGISFTADGAFQLGDSSRSGKLLPEDLKQLSAAIDSATTSTASSESCSDSATENDKTLLKLTTKSQGVKTLLHTDSGKYCHLLSDEDSAKSLQKTVAHMAERYYFQNACVDAELALSGAYEQVRTCNVDSDCTYVAADYSAVDLTAGQDVAAESCSYVSTLSAANAKALVASQESLQTAKNAAWTACGGDFVRYPCSRTSFTADASKPAVCHEHSCKVNPALGF